MILEGPTSRKVIPWILALQKNNIADMADSKAPIPENSFKAIEEFEDELEEEIERRKISVPDIPSLIKGAEIAEKHLKTGSEVDPGRDMTDEEVLNKLMKSQSDLKETIREGKKPVRGNYAGRGRQSKPAPIVEKPLLFDIGEEDPEEEYAESYASQRETAQIREDLDSLADKMARIEERMELMLKEREILPAKLESMRADQNDQLTLILDRLQNALESNVSPLTVTAASAEVERVKADVDDQMTAAVSYTSGEPRKTSPLVDKSADLKGKRRFKPIK